MFYLTDFFLILILFGFCLEYPIQINAQPKTISSTSFPIIPAIIKQIAAKNQSIEILFINSPTLHYVI